MYLFQKLISQVQTSTQTSVAGTGSVARKGSSFLAHLGEKQRNIANGISTQVLLIT